METISMRGKERRRSEAFSRLKAREVSLANATDGGVRLPTSWSCRGRRFASKARRRPKSRVGQPDRIKRSDRKRFTLGASC